MNDDKSSLKFIKNFDLLGYGKAFYDSPWDLHTESTNFQHFTIESFLIYLCYGEWKRWQDFPSFKPFNIGLLYDSERINE